jgi:hypothetical protein
MSFFEPFMCPVQQIAGVVGATNPMIIPVPAPITPTGAFKKQKSKRAWLPLVKRYLEMKVSFAQWRGEM